MTSRYITLQGHKLSLNQFAVKYHFSYTTARRYFDQGLRDQQLLDQLLKIKYATFAFHGHLFSSMRDAAHFYNIPYTTFRRHLGNGTLTQLIKNKD